MSKLSQRIEELTRSKDARTVAGNFMWLSLLQVAGYVFPLITMPYLARVIGVEGFGKIAFAMAVMVWIQTIADWGFNLTATRDVAQNRDDANKVSEIFSNVLWARCLLMGLSFVVLLLLIVAIPTFRENWEVLLVSFLIIPGHILFPDWFFQAVEKMKYITVLNVLTKLIFTLAIFVFIKEPGDYILQPLLSALGFAVSGVIALCIIVYKWRIKILRPKIKIIITTIKSSTDVFINHLLPNLYNSLSTVILGVFGGGSAVGILDGGNKFVSIGNQLIQTIERAFYPFIARRIEKHNILFRVNISIAFIIALILFLGAPLLVDIFLSPEFSASVWVIRIRAISIVFYAISNVYGKNYILLLHKDRLLRQISVRCSLIGFVIAWPMVYYFEYIGAALTVTISLALIAIYSYIEARKLMKQNFRDEQIQNYN